MFLARPFVNPNGPPLVHFGLEVSSPFAVGEKNIKKSIDQQLLLAKFLWFLKRIQYFHIIKIMNVLFPKKKIMYSLFLYYYDNFHCYLFVVLYYYLLTLF